MNPSKLTVVSIPSLFSFDEDYQLFLEAIKSARGKYLCRIYSFILMTKHIHLLLEAVETEPVNNNWTLDFINYCRFLLCSMVLF